MKKVVKIIYFIINHPIAQKKRTTALFRFFYWQIFSRLNLAKSVYHFVNETKLYIVAGQRVTTANYYVGLMEFQEMAFTIHLLDKDDTFFDVGTNVGTFSVIAAGVSNAKTLSFEPVPKTYSFLIKNIKLNLLCDKITALNIGLSDKSGTETFTSNLDANNHIVKGSTNKNTVSIEVKTLNDFKKYTPTLIKIDVEGYEEFILKGGNLVLSQDTLKAIIIEVNNEGDKYKISQNKVHSTLSFYDFEAYEYNPFERKLVKQKNFTSDNRIYIKDFDFVSTRVLNSNHFNVWGIKI